MMDENEIVTNIILEMSKYNLRDDISLESKYRLLKFLLDCFLPDEPRSIPDYDQL